MKETINLYIGYLKNKKRISHNTEEAYNRDLNHFVRFLYDQKVTELCEVTLTTINSYMLMMEKEGLSNATIGRRAAVIRGFFGFLQKRRITEEDAAEFLTAPKVVRQQKVPADASAVLRLITFMEKETEETPKILRDKAMILLLYTSKMKVEELIRLEAEDVHMELGYVSCGSKNGQNAYPLEETAGLVLERYLKEGRPKLLNEETGKLLFPNTGGKKMSRQGFYKNISIYVKKAKITDPVTPSTIRRAR